MEEDLPCKTTFDGGRTQWKTNFDKKTTFNGRRPSMEGNLCWNTTFDGRLNHSGVWVGIMGLGAMLPNHIPALLHTPLCGIFQA